MVHSVALVEDDAQVRKRLESALKNHTELEILGSLGSCAEARDLLSKRLPDVMLIDLARNEGVRVYPLEPQDQVEPPCFNTECHAYFTVNFTVPSGSME